MAKRVPQGPLFIPKNMQQLLQYLQLHPHALLHAGGTYINRYQKRGDFSYPDGIIFLHFIPDLEKISRTERYLEIGSCVTLSKLLDIGRSLLPAPLLLALRQIGTQQVRNSATVGGNIAVPGRRMDLFPVLVLMNIRVELRRSGGSRWVQLNRLFDDDNISEIHPGEIITRFRIPFDTWDVQGFRKVGSNDLFSNDTLIFCGLAKTQKELIQDFRFCFGGIKHLFLRDKTIENELIGKKLPVQDKIRESVNTALKKRIEKSPVDLNETHRFYIDKLFNGFLDAASHNT